MEILKNKIKLAGLLIIMGMVAGILSISPSVDSVNYLTEAAANFNQVIMSALFQFILFLMYLGFAIVLYPIIKKYNKSLALGFLSFRIIAGVVLLIGTVVLLSILVLSQEYAENTLENLRVLEALGNVLKTTRDYTNHVFMVFVLSIGNLMLYVLFLKSKLIPKWLSVWGLLGGILSIIASTLLLFKIIDVITVEYLVLNVPTALFEIVLGFWLLLKGFSKEHIISVSYE
ncbi:DUF4386 domain-containing protein [Flavobacterium sp. J27]|uniref:DUF4386 domain-containing protein n=1 Tax=Flavobacterium sp. J27 TaxID=2060419 RepID=UPI00103029A5|nr:DUF4386 domain-containing protein [Flavobacterium sp. J27]